MPAIALPLASHFLTGSILTLVMPLGGLLVVCAWYTILWRRGARRR